MREGLLGVILLKFAVDFLLFYAAGKLCRDAPCLHHVLVGAMISAIIMGLCLRPELMFLQLPFWRIVSFGLSMCAAFGFRESSLSKSAVYVLLNFAVGAFGWESECRKMGMLLASACGIALVCLFLPEDGGRKPIPVELEFGNRTLSLHALCDNGNNLRDPLTGCSVLIIDANAAWRLLGLTREQLSDPVNTLCSGVLPGLRLIPYRTIGSAGKFLLAMKLKRVRIGGSVGSRIVAFAPEIMEAGCGYQALMGGNL